MTVRALLLPGLYNSGPDHWQSHWERSDPTFLRVEQQDWDRPRRADWVAVLEAAVARYGPAVVLVGHSTSCALVAFWGAETRLAVRGALLVAPSDTEAPSYPQGPVGWAPMPRARLPFPTIVAASRDDPYVAFDRAADFAGSWGGRLVDLGALGHVNSASHLGMWPVGRALLEELMGP